MKVKEFFKLTKWKLILTLVIVVVLTIILSNIFITYYYGICNMMQPYPEGCQKIPIPSIWFVILLIVSYIVSCLIMLIYNKIKSKNKGKKKRK